MTAKERRRAVQRERQALDDAVMDWLLQNPGPHSIRVITIGMTSDSSLTFSAAQLESSLQRLVRQRRVREGLRAQANGSTLTYSAVDRSLRW